MTDYRLTQQLMAKALASEHPDEAEHALELAQSLLEIAVAHGLITQARLQAHERDAKMYELSGTMPVVAIAERFQCTRKHAHTAIRKQLLIRRAS